MELLIALGIGVLGYRMSAGGDDGEAPSRPRRRPEPLDRPDALRRGGGEAYDPIASDRRAAAAAWRDSLDPRTTGVIDPRTMPAGMAGAPGSAVPFFRSAKAQNTNAKVKQTRMELFTGGLDADESATGTYRRKREAAAFFKPGESASVPVTFSGSVGQPAADLATAAERTWVSGLQNNVLPAPQLRVGPGLGLRPDQLTGCDGFHPMLRVLPKNVGEYKKVNLPGAVNHGAAPITARDAQPGTQTRDPNADGRADGSSGPVFWDMERRPMQPTRAAVTAPRLAPNAPRDGSTAAGHRPLYENYLGNPVGTVCGVSGPVTTQGDATRGGNQALAAFPATNVTGAATGPATLSLTGADFDPARFDSTQREQRPPELGGPVAGVSRGAETRPFDAPGTTLRQVTGFDALGRGGLQNVQGSEPARTFGAPGATLRELSTRVAGEVLNPKAAVTAQRADLGQPQALDRQAKRWEYSAQTAQRPAPGRTNVRADASVAAGAVALRDDDRQVPDNAVPALPVPRYDATPGALTTTFNKLPSANPRLDLGVAAAQLASNPLAKTW